MSYVIVGAASAAFGFILAAIFNSQAYDKGFDDGWDNRCYFEQCAEREVDEP